MLLFFGFLYQFVSQQLKENEKYEKTDRENDEEFIANPDVDGVVDTFKKQGKK